MQGTAGIDLTPTTTYEFLLYLPNVEDFFVHIQAANSIELVFYSTTKLKLGSLPAT